MSEHRGRRWAQTLITFNSTECGVGASHFLKEEKEKCPRCCKVDLSEHVSDQWDFKGSLSTSWPWYWLDLRTLMLNGSLSGSFPSHVFSSARQLSVQFLFKTTACVWYYICIGPICSAFTALSPDSGLSMTLLYMLVCLLLPSKQMEKWPFNGNYISGTLCHNERRKCVC